MIKELNLYPDYVGSEIPEGRQGELVLPTVLEEMVVLVQNNGRRLEGSDSVMNRYCFNNGEAVVYSKKISDDEQQVQRMSLFSTSRRGVLDLFFEIPGFFEKYVNARQSVGNSKLDGSNTIPWSCY